jgi:uncharacterized protein
LQAFLRGLSDRAELILVSTICFSYFILTSLLALLGGVRHADLGTGGVLWGIFAELLILGVFAFILRARGWDTGRLGLRFSWKAAAAGIPLFVIYLLLYWITATLVLLLFPAARAIESFTFSNHAPVVLIVAFLVLHSFFEELTVTAYVITSLSEHGAGFAITASTLLRFAYHLHQGPVASLSIIPLGLLFGMLFWRRRNIWPLIVAHMITNLVTFALQKQA